MIIPRDQSAPAGGDGARGRQASSIRVHLVMTIALSMAIAVAATAVSMGGASAQGAQVMTRPDTGLVLALLLVAVGVMGALSAVAVRLAGRTRHRG
jgi:hypothetical protein